MSQRDEQLAAILAALNGQQPPAPRTLDPGVHPDTPVAAQDAAADLRAAHLMEISSARWTPDDASFMRRHLARVGPGLLGY
jgi:hypothetical protein